MLIVIVRSALFLPIIAFPWIVAGVMTVFGLPGGWAYIGVAAFYLLSFVTATWIHEQRQKERLAVQSGETGDQTSA